LVSLDEQNVSIGLLFLLSVRLKVVQDMLLALNYHYVRSLFDAPYPGIHGISPESFRAQLEELTRVGEFVSGVDICRAIGGDGALPERAFLVTFDDGLREQYEEALPVLEQLKIPAVFFVNPNPLRTETLSLVHKIHLARSETEPERFAALVVDYMARLGVDDACWPTKEQATGHYQYDTPEIAQVKYLLSFVLDFFQTEELIEKLFVEIFGDAEREMSRRLYMTTEQVRALGKLEQLGNHGDEHVPMGLLDDAAIRNQMHRSTEWFDDVAGVIPYAFSYPYGSLAACTAIAGKEAALSGAKFGLTMERAINASLHSPMFLSRFACNDLPPNESARWKLEDIFSKPDVRSWHMKPEGSAI
jgi:peptidoglycan/xylan/chitin deacetylase (PgdA/CDA1 family)